ncbi:MAG TPA: hypothetical protein VMS22_10100 [Candidatus Eisenbacteria bacterium]|nr:hypothetical protein [Candidatus Eisenbacteria bacterium]
MIDRQRALHFAGEWIAAWNVFHPPRIAVVFGDDGLVAKSAATYA